MCWAISIAVNTFVLLRCFVDANPIGNFATGTVIIKPAIDNATTPIDNATTPVASNSPSDCDSAHPYCCNPPLNPPSISDLFNELNHAINVLGPACTNNSFKENVSM